MREVLVRMDLMFTSVLHFCNLTPDALCFIALTHIHTTSGGKYEQY
jgi:hypothetical protein